VEALAASDFFVRAEHNNTIGIKMLTVLFDTNILHQEGLYSSRIQRFQRLLKNSECKLIIPEIVIKEYKTKRVSIAKKEFSNIDRCLATLQKKKFITSNRGLFSYSFNHTCEDCINNISTEIDSWVNENNVEIYKISNTSIDTLFANYFEGNGAFREPKCREDIPDAVIYDAIVNIAKNTKLYVIVKDGGLQKSLKNIENVEYFSSLDDFLNIDSIKEITIKFDDQNLRINTILNFLESIDCAINLQSYFYKVGINGIGYTFSSEYLKFPIDYDEINIINPEVIATETEQEKDFYFHKSHYLGNNKFSASFSFESKATINFDCHEEEYEYLPYKIRKQLSTKVTDDLTILHVSE
jgi:rRNA-processing protein FCF1